MGAVGKTRYITQAGWPDAPHLSQEVQEAMLADIEPHLRAARSMGEPTMGSGAIYPIAFEDIAEAPFRIPDHWPRAYGMDVGWNRTAVIWGALDRSTDTIHLYSEYYAGKQLPAVHAVAIKARGAWIPGVIDPAARGRSQYDGEQLLAGYTSESVGLKLTVAHNAVETGLQEVWSRLVTQRIKVFTTLMNFRKEFILYKRDENGKVVKVDDHLMDAMRYLTVSGAPIMRVQQFRPLVSQTTGAADRIAGY
jgi:hypothetical protein